MQTLELLENLVYFRDMRKVPLNVPGPIPGMSRMHLRDNARLAQIVAALPPFECAGLTVRVALCHIVHADRGQSAGLHRHGYMEVTFITAGEVHYATEREVVPVPVGKAYLMPPGIPHRWDAAGKLNVLFGFMLELQADDGDEAVRHLEDAVKQAHYAVALDPLVIGQFHVLARAVVGEESVSPVLAAPVMQALLMMTLRQLVATEVGRPPSQAARQRALFEQARTYIDANLEQVIYRDELARFLGIGGRQLNRIFRAEGERSVTAYLLERRLERARMLLAKGLPVKEVAFTCGFRTPSYFSRFFKQYTGRAPSHKP